MIQASQPLVSSVGSRTRDELAQIKSNITKQLVAETIKLRPQHCNEFCSKLCISENKYVNMMKFLTHRGAKVFVTKYKLKLDKNANTNTINFICGP